MGMYNITGWSGGGRRPLTYNLMPGQFRNTRVNVFPSQTIINNNIGNFGSFGGCYDYGDCCCGGGNDKTPSWMNWMMGIGMVGTLVGGIMSLFGGGGAKETEGAGGKEKTPDNTAKDWVKTIKNSFPDAKLSATPDGRYMLNGKIYDTHDEVLAELNKTPEKPAATTTPTNTTPAKTPATDPFTMQLFKGDGVSFKNAGEEEAKFNELTNHEVFKLDSNFSEITIDKLIDQGGPRDWDIENVKISQGADGKLTCSPAKIDDKQVSAETLGGKYIRLTVGDQTYIVGNDGNGYQYENGNVEGFREANWRGGRGVTPPPTAKTPNIKADKSLKPQDVKDTEAKNQIDKWNKEHPDKKVTYSNNQFSTTVQLGTNKKTITAGSFEQLKQDVEKWIKEQKDAAVKLQNSRVNHNRSGYATLGGAMNSHFNKH